MSDEHWSLCYLERGHHGCAIAHIVWLERRLAQIFATPGSLARVRQEEAARTRMQEQEAARLDSKRSNMGAAS